MFELLKAICHNCELVKRNGCLAYILKYPKSNHPPDILRFLTCWYCGKKLTNSFLHVMINDNDVEFCSKKCIKTASKRYPRSHFTLIEKIKLSITKERVIFT